MIRVAHYDYRGLPDRTFATAREALAYIRGDGAGLTSTDRYLVCTGDEWVTLETLEGLL